MNKTILFVAIVSMAVAVAMTGALAAVLWQRFDASSAPDNLSLGVTLQNSGQEKEQQEQERRIAAAPEKRMSGGGLAGVMGGAQVKLSSGRPQEILLPLPQLADGQVPLCYFISGDPADAVKEIRLRKLEDCNDVVSIRLEGRGREVKISWSAVVLLAAKDITPNTTPPEPYREATACVQSQAREITQLAAANWPESGKAGDFAANIQRQIGQMKRKSRPRSLDARGILQSGESGICTANANLAAALMRSQGIPCRTLAVVPPISQRLEMHRIVEFHEEGKWKAFDPSSLQTEIPARPWHNIILAKTTPWDEQKAMKPRMGAMTGSPYGQELELLTSGVNLHGQDFFWTIARPLAEFEPSDEAIQLAADAWRQFLKTGALTTGQRQAASTQTSAELEECLRTK